tara:strand:+ start:490 stop:888 length:399 start_codon:yes stop_codon:yes gene_type:complete
MAKLEWGKKRICLACNTKYYDFKKSPIICPSCGTEFDPDIYLKSKKGKSLSTKLVSEDNENISENISNIDDIATDSNEEVVVDDDPILDINNENQDADAEDEINIDDDISFIDEDEINGDDSETEEIIDEEK